MACEKEKVRVTERQNRKRPGIVWLRGRKNRKDSKTKKAKEKNSRMEEGV